MRVKFTLLPVGKKTVLPISCNYFLTSLIYKIIRSSSENYSRFLHDEGYKLAESKKGFKLFTYSMLMGDDAKVSGDKIIFGKGKVHWQISSPVDEFIQHLITGVFAEGVSINRSTVPQFQSSTLNGGTVERETVFLIERVETLPAPEFKSVMKFTCLSPITISKTCSTVQRFNGSTLNGGTVKLETDNTLNGETVDRGTDTLNGETVKRLNCHYIRPWEDGFSEAIKNNLIKKYKLITGKDIDDSEFKIKVDTEYMNRKSGKITKNINFKGTNIIGFMAPFEVTGNPELIKIGYEAGFGEKGSMGFGMIKETVQCSTVQRFNGLRFNGSTLNSGTFFLIS